MVILWCRCSLDRSDREKERKKRDNFSKFNSHLGNYGEVVSFITRNYGTFSLFKIVLSNQKLCGGPGAKNNNS